MMDFNIVQAVKDGTVVVTRCKTCQWCGESATERIVSFEEDKPYRPEFSCSGFGAVVIVPYGTANIERREIVLCPKCAGVLEEFLLNRTRFNL